MYGCWSWWRKNHTYAVQTVCQYLVKRCHTETDLTQCLPLGDYRLFFPLTNDFCCTTSKGHKYKIHVNVSNFKTLKYIKLLFKNFKKVKKTDEIYFTTKHWKVWLSRFFCISSSFFFPIHRLMYAGHKKEKKGLLHYAILQCFYRIYLYLCHKDCLFTSQDRKMFT